jgi:hypothetical protein
MEKSVIRRYVWRFVVILLVASLLSWAISETAFRFQKFNIDRAPETITLVIPDGTANRIALGEAVSTLPEEMVFVLGDVLVVQNQDSVSHELGPLLIPPGSSARMPMDNVDNYAANCSFQPSRYLGLDVKAPTTWRTRLLAVSFAAPPTAVMVFLYSLVIKPIKVEEKD